MVGQKHFWGLSGCAAGRTDLSILLRMTNSEVYSKNIIFSLVISTWGSSFRCLHKLDLYVWPVAGRLTWPTGPYPVLMSFPFCLEFSYLANFCHTQLTLREGSNFSYEILTLEGTYVISLVPLRVAEMIEIFKIIYTNY